MNILVSACLMGVQCRYDGTGILHEKIKDGNSQHHFIPVCPEIFGGLPTPRVPAEIIAGKVITKTGVDVTKEYDRGAMEVLRLAKYYNCTTVILKERSPSCGCKYIYDGSFNKVLISGVGITAKLLMEHGIQVFGESEIGYLENGSCKC